MLSICADEIKLMWINTQEGATGRDVSSEGPGCLVAMPVVRLRSPCVAGTTPLHLQSVHKS